MSILGNFPAASTKDDAFGYYQYLDGTKIPLTGVEIIPGETTVLNTFSYNSKPMYFSAAFNGFDICTEDGKRRFVDYSGNIQSSSNVGYPLTACSLYGGITYAYAYTKNGVHYLVSDNLTLTSHAAKIISCYKDLSDTIYSVDESGVVICHEYISSSNSYVMKWSIVLNGCTSVYSFRFAVGTVIKMLNPLDGSILDEIDVGHNIVKLDSKYAYCDDGCVVNYDYSIKRTTDSSGNATSYTGTLSIKQVLHYDQNVNHICTQELSSVSCSTICFTDGTVAKLGPSGESFKWTYTDNTNQALFSGFFGYSTCPTVVIARENGDVEILSTTPEKIKIYFKSEESMAAM